MIMQIPSPWWAGAALAAVLGLLWLLSRGLRVAGFARAGGRRLAMQDVLALDSRRRLLLVRCDGRDLLLLTGGTQDAMLGWLDAATRAAEIPS